MEEPSSPLTPSNFASSRMQPNSGTIGAASSLSSIPCPAYPDVCLLPNAKVASMETSYGLPKPRHDILSSSMQQNANPESFSSRVNDEKHVQAFLQVDTCEQQLGPPHTNWEYQPITPSPQSSSALRDNSSGGWKCAKGGNLSPNDDG